MTAHLQVMKLFPNDEADGVPAHALREVSLLRYLRHPNIVRCAARTTRTCYDSVGPVPERIRHTSEGVELSRRVPGVSAVTLFGAHVSRGGNP